MFLKNISSCLYILWRRINKLRCRKNRQSCVIVCETHRIIPHAEIKKGKLTNYSRLDFLTDKTINKYFVDIYILNVFF